MESVKYLSFDEGFFQSGGGGMSAPQLMTGWNSHVLK